MKLLLLSNSTTPQGFLSHALPWLNGFIDAAKGRVLFVPFAGVSISWEDYCTKVSEVFEPMGLELVGIQNLNPAETDLNSFDAIAVGGGNTFQLLKEMQERNWMHKIKEAVINGLPFVGWSAGSNVACPFIYTTNDMPIVQPVSFEALGLFPYQINPHYTEESLPHHKGETRLQRITEFTLAHPAMPVIGLKEGTAIIHINGQNELLGGDAALIRYDQERIWVSDLHGI
jgi:dipeptidase E